MSVFIDDNTKKRFTNLTNMFDITSKNEVEFSKREKKVLGQLDSSQETASVISGSSDACNLFSVPMGKKKAMKKSSLGKGRQDELKIQLESDPNPNISSAIDARAGKGKHVGHRTGKAKPFVGKSVKYKEETDEQMMKRHRSGVKEMKPSKKWAEPEWHQNTTEMKEEQGMI